MKLLRFLILSCLLLIPVLGRAADVYEIEPTHTKIIFMVDHMGFSKTIGWFAKFEGTFTMNEDNIPASSANVFIDPSSIYTAVPALDDKLRGSDFFDVKKYPHMSFVSKSIKKTGDKTAIITGELTMHGVSKPVELDVTLNKKADDPYNGRFMAGLSAHGKLKRSDFGMNNYIPAVGDMIDIWIELEAFHTGTKVNQ